MTWTSWPATPRPCPRGTSNTSLRPTAGTARRVPKRIGIPRATFSVGCACQATNCSLMTSVSKPARRIPGGQKQRVRRLIQIWAAMGLGLGLGSSLLSSSWVALAEVHGLCCRSGRVPRVGRLKMKRGRWRCNLGSRRMPAELLALGTQCQPSSRTSRRWYGTTRSRRRAIQSTHSRVDMRILRILGLVISATVFRWIQDWLRTLALGSPFDELAAQSRGTVCYAVPIVARWLGDSRQAEVLTGPRFFCVLCVH
mmetsp:Transcript_4589/g.10057  ORF Transcript_4589/g.10057 Transcript_4589/m.10057 type:complete len:254 (-) Transcript_4589:59-820(-)